MKCPICKEEKCKCKINQDIPDAYKNKINEIYISYEAFWYYDEEKKKLYIGKCYQVECSK